MLSVMLVLAGAAADRCVMDDDTKRFPLMRQSAYFRGDQYVVRPGDTIRLTAEWRDGPYGEKQLPLPCLTKWKVDRKQATLAKDRRTLRISDTAAADSTVAVTAMIGKRPVNGSFRITGRDEKVLYGKWTEVASTGCGKGARRVAELVFGYGGGYSFTFPDMMVETMTSGGGDYRWDAATGALDLKGDKASATLDGDTLSISGKQFDQAVVPEIVGYDAKADRPVFAPATACRITFRPIAVR